MRKLQLLVLSALALAGAWGEEVPYGVLPSKAHLAYQEREILGLVCWGLNTFTGQEWGFGNVPTSKITADRLDPAQWVRAMKSAEIKSVVLVAKHHDGFNLWPSPLNPGYSMAAVPAPNTGRDLVRELADACRKEGLGFGVYLSPWDRHQGSYAKPEYVDYFHKQWEEVLTKYGDICEVWLDGANGGTGWYGGVNGEKGERRAIPKDYYDIPRLIERVKELHPLAVLFGGAGERSAAWCGNERGWTPETWWCVRKGRDGKDHWMPSETDTPFRRRGWYWHPHDQPKPLSELVRDYFTSVGMGAVLDFGISPDRHGQICPEDAKRMQEFGDYVRAFNAVDFAEGAKCAERRDGNDLVVELELAGEKRFNCVDFRERIELGQRVAEYRVEVFENGTWREVAKGTTVGHRRIARFGVVRATKVRLTVKGRAKPLLKPIALRYAPKVRSEQCGAKDTYDKTDWTIVDQTTKNTRNAMSAIDGEAHTLWHSHASGEDPLPPPQSFTVDCKETLLMHGFDYLPRQDRCLHGMVDAYEFRVSTDGKEWRLVGSGEFGNLKANPVSQRVTFAQPVKARYFKFTATRAIAGEGSNRVAVAELDIW